MTSRLDEEELHPLVSSLLEGRLLPTTTTANVPTKSYTREQMMTLRTTKLSMTQPDNLSVEFNGDDGKFSPFKWLEYRWEIEGIKNRPSSKKIDSLCAGADDNTGLSPQRRAFSSGCRAPDGEKSREGGHEKDIIDRLGGHGKNWRNGSTGGSEKYGAKGAAGHYQKPGYGQQQRSEWKRNDKDARATNNRFGNPRRDERAGSVSGSEKLPEWADGPTTMDDMIELRGFDEPKKGKKKKEQKKEKPVVVPEVNPLSASGSRPPSADLTNNKGNVETIEDSAIESAETAYSTTSTAALPETDQLAALLGVLDTNVTKPKRESPEDTAPRFFKLPANMSIILKLVTLCFMVLPVQSATMFEDSGWKSVENMNAIFLSDLFNVDVAYNLVVIVLLSSTLCIAYLMKKKSIIILNEVEQGIRNTQTSNNQNWIENRLLNRNWEMSLNSLENVLTNLNARMTETNSYHDQQIEVLNQTMENNMNNVTNRLAEISSRLELNILQLTQQIPIVVVSNISYRATRDQLVQLIPDYEKLNFLPTSRGFSRGVALFQFRSQEEAIQCIQNNNGTIFMERRLKVELAFSEVE